MTDMLADKVAIVTGAAQGFGLAIAKRFAEEGATVVLSDIDGAAVERESANIPRSSHTACDVTDEQQVKALVDHAVERHGALHVMVANAGVGNATPILNMDYKGWREVTSVNLDGVFLSLRYAAPAIIEAGGGSIVTMASVTGTNGSPFLAHYAASKAAVINLTRTAATELRAQGVRVNSVQPGFVDTELVTSAAPNFEAILGLPKGGFDDLIAQKQGRYGTPEEVAEAVLFFASDRSSFCTGSGLEVDGGLQASLL